MSGLFDQSYQPWTGTLQPRPFRFLAITWTGVINTWRRSPVALLICGGIAMLFSLPNAFIGLMMPALGDPAFVVSATLSSSMTWTFLLIMPVVGSGLIANDIKHNALLMYFSKSIYRTDYVLGKAMTAAVFLFLPLLLAPMLAAGLGVYGLGEVATTGYTCRLFLGLMACAPIAALPGIAVVMAFSSCTKRTFLAGTGWVVLYLVLESVSSILSAAAKLKWGYLLSISSNVFRVAKEILPDPPAELKLGALDPAMKQSLETPYSAWYSAGILAGVFVIGLSIVIWRVSNAERRS